MDGHLGCFQLSAIVNNAAKDTGVQIHLWTLLSIFGIYTQSGMTGSCGKWIFHFWWTTYYIHSCCPILHSYSQHRRFNSSIWARRKHSPEEYMTCSRLPQCLQNQGCIHSFLALWMLALFFFFFFWINKFFVNLVNIHNWPKNFNGRINFKTTWKAISMKWFSQNLCHMNTILTGRGSISWSCVPPPQQVHPKL